MSYDELLALTFIARVNLMVVEARAGAAHYTGDNLADVARPAEPTLAVSIRGMALHKFNAILNVWSPCWKKRRQQV